jgi:hypothetical protein
VGVLILALPLTALTVLPSGADPLHPTTAIASGALSTLAANPAQTSGVAALSGSTSATTNSSLRNAQALSSPSAAKVVPAYWLVASDGGIFSFGGTKFYGSMGGKPLNQPIVGMATTHDGGGYWEVASDGGLFSFGDAKFYGSMGGVALDAPIVGMATTPDGLGYWEVASDGGMFTFGDATFYGSMGGQPLNQPIVGLSPTADGKGYWLVASDGGIFAFGDAKFYGSMGGKPLNSPVTDMVPGGTKGGYTMVAKDGGLFNFGDAPFLGSLGGVPLSRPIVAMATTPDDGGYWFTDNNGAVSAFGDAGNYGSAPQVLVDPIVGMAEGPGNGSYTNTESIYPSGSYGYDVSNYQCGNLPTGDHTIGVVEVVGISFGAVNKCLGQEAAWAASGLNLYAFLSYGTKATGPAACNGDQACNFGFAAALDAVAKAQSAHINTQLTWWLDVEGAGLYWSSNTTENMQVVEGAIAGIRSQGINDVGIYASPDVWNSIVGSYQPAVPYWMADYLYTPSGPGNCALVSHYRATDQLPTGPVVITQYTDDAGGYDGDYAC